VPAVHTHPENFVRPKDQVFNIAYEHPDDEKQQSMGKQLVQEYNIHSKITCSTCHDEHSRAL